MEIFHYRKDKENPPDCVPFLNLLSLPFWDSVAGCGQDSTFGITDSSSGELGEQKRGPVNIWIRSIFGFFFALSHLGFSQLFDFLDLFIWQEVQVAHNVRAVPFILLFNGLQQQVRVPVAILVTAEETATPCFILGTNI